MIDLHSHILWDLDDGARTFDESLAMLRIAAETGTTDIVASPHANCQFPFRSELVEERVAKLREAAGDVIRVHPACDFHLHYNNIQDALAHPDKYTIAHRSYLLVEFSEMFIDRQMDAVIARMMEAGILPVITHPERNRVLQQRLESLTRWVEEGCLLQVTAQVFLGRFGSKSKRFVELLLSKNLVHVVASDAHDCEDRPPRLDLAYAHVAKNYSIELAQCLFVENPGKVLKGDTISAVPSSNTRRRWFD